MRAAPIFLDFLNREANDAAASLRSEATDIDILRTLLLTHSTKLSVNISQMSEYCFGRPNLHRATAALVRAGKIDATSQAASMDAFIASRQRIYAHVSERYPFFFSMTDKVLAYRIGSRNNFDMTTELTQRLLSYKVGGFPFDLLRSSGNDLEVLAGRFADFRKVLLRRDEKAVTAELFREAHEAHNFKAAEVASFARIISALYMQLYAQERGLAVVTGVPDFHYKEDDRYFPNFDYPVLRRATHLLGDASFLAERDFEELVEAHGGAAQARFTFSLEALISALFAMLRARENTPGSLDIRRERMVQLLLSVFFDGGRQGYKSLEDFFGSGMTKILTEGARLARHDNAFSSEWASYMRESSGVRILIATATEKEDEALHSVLAAQGFSERRIVRSGEGFVVEYGRGISESFFHIRTSAGAIGVNSAGVALPLAIKQLQINHLISVGICFGLRSEEDKLCDVVVSTAFNDYETVRQEDGREEERGEPLPCGPGLLQAVRIVRGRNPDDSVKVIQGLLLSGQKLVDSRDFVAELRRRFPKAVAGDMEASAIAAASVHAGCQWITIKGICDWGYDKDKKHQPQAAKNASELCLRVVDVLLKADTA